MKKILFGFIAGLFTACMFYFFLFPDPKARATTGWIMDKDTIYFSNGELTRGWIKEESPVNIMIETDTGYFTMPRERCINIQRDVFLKYLRQVNQAKI